MLILARMPIVNAKPTGTASSSPRPFTVFNIPVGGHTDRALGRTHWVMFGTAKNAYSLSVPPPPL